MARYTGKVPVDLIFSFQGAVRGVSFVEELSLHWLGHLPEKNQRSFVSSLVLNENFFILALARDMREMGG